MKISMLAGLALSMVVVATGCSSSVVREAAAPATPKVDEPVAAAPRLDARLLPGEYEVVYGAPEVTRSLATPMTSPNIRPEAASKKGKLLLGDVHAISFQ